MINNQERQWAQAIKLSKQQAARPDAIALRQNQLPEEMQYFKNKLLALLKDKQRTEAKKCLQTLFKLRAEQTVLAIADMQERGELTADETQKGLQKYYHDCAAVTAAANALLQHHA